ncbi:BREX-1 system adenine-specific DNA-methyltransferase PglX [Schinkia azotoformans]|uniref:BREX-1 system adenine-specific DNA-methyltransferase PglX n=1 Tax=Schinkia azotoformans TaxID=1454 RepID=UPI002DC04CFD|nr:BREX-1 system adenine-specific DNA-methyltransferase PglX [Schinkia azotoformans]MEC1759881.1 BREX-1 system adenine-specific DNA-methyltransferase PglX [Schinkia azotoformans]
MNKSALKTFATNARKELLKKVEAKAMKIGITEDNIKKADVESSDAIFIDGKQLSKEEKNQRDKLIARINQIGFKQVMEEVAYTWFNRFTALRFMEVNDYLPSGVRVLSSSNPNSADPDMLNEALELDLEVELDKELIYNLKLNNETEELFKYLIIKHCNDLNRFLPFMFEMIDDYTEVLFPDGLLAKESIIRQMTDTDFIPDSTWEEVEIIGWLYQYYNTELNDLVYDGNMSKSRIPKDLLPAATQLFTPDWAVKYMVENSLGRLWLNGHLNENLQENWKYYLENEEKPNSNSQINPEEIKILDPCMGSGHILVYAFEVLMQIYQSNGYLPREAAKLILSKNLYGLEIDDRAYQLSCFSVVMKARKYNRRIFDEKIELNLYSFVESNTLSKENIKDVINLEKKDLETALYLIDVFKNSKEYGSILKIESRDFDSLNNALLHTPQEFGDLFQNHLLSEINDLMPMLIKQAQIMTEKYDIVITNPPYLGNSRMSPLLDDYVKNHYPNTKSDLSMVMYQKAIESYSKKDGYISFITTTSWMYLKSFEEFRKVVLKSMEFCSIVDFGTELFDGKVGHNPIVSWVNQNSNKKSEIIAIRLTDYCYSKRDQKEIQYFNLENRYYPNQEKFTKIPGSPIAYWAHESVFLMFEENGVLADISFPRLGMATADNNRFLRYWYEVEWNNIGIKSKDRQMAKESGCKWFPYNKGGEFRKWYGNNEYVVDWENDGESIRNFVDEKGKVRSHNYNLDFIFKPGITWSALSSGPLSSRVFSEGFLFDNAGSSLFTEEVQNLYLIQGYLSTKIIKYILPLINATLNYQPGTIGSLPFKKSIDSGTRKKIDDIVKESIEVSKRDWDAFETSWDFKKHPILEFQKPQINIENAFNNWSSFTVEQFSKLKTNEEELNRIFIDIYGLQDVLTPEIDDKDVTIRKADLEREIKSLISYAIGCILGRYSLDQEGTIYAGGKFDFNRYSTLQADKDNILPILPSAYFEDDIISKFIEFVKVAFGEEVLAGNLEFIAGTLGKKKGETAKETIRRYFLNDFFKDHVKIYQKRPIYWLFTSGKQKAFNCLIYMHRYDKTTLSRIRTDYLHEYQIRLDAEQKDLLSIIEGDYTTKEISNAKKELKVLENKIEELKEYDELLHHMADMQIELDLDDGVVVNYKKFNGLVAKI